MKRFLVKLLFPFGGHISDITPLRRMLAPYERYHYGTNYKYSTALSGKYMHSNIQEFSHDADVGCPRGGMPLPFLSLVALQHRQGACSSERIA